jgi:hypothetical protein
LSQKILHKKGLGRAQGVCPEFKPQNCKQARNERKKGRREEGRK